MNSTLRTFLTAGLNRETREGLRGRVELHPLSDALAAPDGLSAAAAAAALEGFVRQGALTPALVELYCRAFVRMCRKTGRVLRGGGVVFADDGRDAATGGSLRAAALRGFAAEGLAVHDIGVAPTPAAVVYAAYLEAPLTVVLTGSHRPSNINGLKLFVDGLKLLPEGDLSHAALTRELVALAASSVATRAAGELRVVARGRKAAAAHQLHRQGAIGAGVGEIGEDPNIASGLQPAIDPAAGDPAALARRVFVQSILSILPAVNWRRAGVEIVFDGGNGAAAQFGLDLLRTLGVPHRAVNVKPDGRNVNSGAAAVMLQGHEQIPGQGRRARELPGGVLLRTLFAAGRRNGTKRWTVGLAVDGDGDRGLLLLYDPKDDSVRVIGGDQQAYIQAAIDQTRRLLPVGALFITTVAGDVMVAQAAQQNLRLRVWLAPPGDAWLTQPAREGQLLAAAAEDHGHVIRMLPVSSRSGGMQYALTANALLTGVNLVAGVLAGEYSRVELARPFPAGFQIDACTWHVDRDRFAPGTRVWEAERRMIERCFKRAYLRNPKLRQRKIQFRRQVFSEDRGLLCYHLVDRDERRLATLSVRNGAQERKIEIAIRGQRGFQTLLQAMLRELQAHHRLEMKDSRLRATLIERRILGLIKQRGPLYPTDLLTRLNRRVKDPAGTEEFESVLRELVEEGRLKISEWVELA
ncbi:MAG: hypothetical protein ACREJ2_06555 [Planctomycetota bacterium]